MTEYNNYLTPIVGARDLKEALQGRDLFGRTALLTDGELIAAYNEHLVVAYGSTGADARRYLVLEGAVQGRFPIWGGAAGGDGDGCGVTVKPESLTACADRDPVYDRNHVEAVWHINGTPWIITASFPCERFKLMLDGREHCSGIVFPLDSLERDVAPEGASGPVCAA